MLRPFLLVRRRNLPDPSDLSYRGRKETSQAAGRVGRAMSSVTSEGRPVKDA